ncbi:MAG: hypothetical protein H5T74_13330 [Actinobacteria bacterium]|nr:hypothetical protein [Actinomycetota bacterium]
MSRKRVAGSGSSIRLSRISAAVVFMLAAIILLASPASAAPGHREMAPGNTGEGAGGGDGAVATGGGPYNSETGAGRVAVKGAPVAAARAAGTYVTDFEAAAYPFTSIAFEGLWGREAYTGAHGGQLYASFSGGDALEVIVEVPINGAKLTLYSARYWQCGYCAYTLVNNGTGRVVTSGTVNLYYDNYDSNSPQWNYRVFRVAGLKRGTYTLRVENLGRPGTDRWPQEILEYFEQQGIEPPPLPHMVNVDYLELKV